jgi:hypothetical protein
MEGPLSLDAFVYVELKSGERPRIGFLAVSPIQSETWLRVADCRDDLY